MGHKKASGVHSQMVKFIPHNMDFKYYLDFEYGYFTSIAEFMARLKISPLRRTSGTFAEIDTSLSAFDKYQYDFMTLPDMGEPRFPTFLKKMDKVIKGFHSGSVNLLFCHKHERYRLMYFVKYLMLMAQHEQGLNSKKVVCIDSTSYPFYRRMLTFVNNYEQFTLEHIKNIFFINTLKLRQLHDAVDGLKGMIETYQPKLVVITSPFASIRRKHPIKNYLIPYEVETTSIRSTEAARLVMKIKKIARNTGTIFLLTHYVNWYKVFKTKDPYLYNSVSFDTSIFLKKERDNELKLHITHVRQKDVACKIKLDTIRKRLRLKDICYGSMLKGTKVIRNNITLKYPELAYCMEVYNKFGVKFVIFKFKQDVRKVHKLRNMLGINRSLDIVIWADDSVSIYNLEPDSINLASLLHFGGVPNEQTMMIGGTKRLVQWIRMYPSLYRKFFDSFEEFFLHFLNINLTNPLI